ncbi:hypothetical protein Tco_1461275, partial [Tanacetum coccineum]
RRKSGALKNWGPKALDLLALPLSHYWLAVTVVTLLVTHHALPIGLVAFANDLEPEEDEEGEAMKIDFECCDQNTFCHVGDSHAWFGNYVGDLVREFSMHYPSRYDIPTAKKAHIQGRLLLAGSDKSKVVGSHPRGAYTQPQIDELLRVRDEQVAVATRESQATRRDFNQIENGEGGSGSGNGEGGVVAGMVMDSSSLRMLQVLCDGS